ncbi:MAG: signal recognition particle-docking protein FtsY [Nanoarchaeota archaeon]
MFEAFKKKIMSWIKPDEKKPKKLAAARKKIKEKKQKKAETLTKQEKENFQEAEQILKEAETPIKEEESPVSSNFFTKLIKKITTSKLSQDEFNDSFQDLEITLLENNVALEAVDKIKESLSKDLVNQQLKKTEAPARILQALKESIISLLIEPPPLFAQIKNSSMPYVILFFGINGTGKTTSIAKLAHLLKKNNISCVLAAADTFRAASIEQLKIHAEAIKIPMINKQYGSDPASVAFDAISYAKKHAIQAVLIDTAGRMYTKENLLKEMEKIVRISKPNLKLFVGESITGNDAIEQAKTFNNFIGIDGIILTKADIDEKAGTILSVSYVTKKPIYFLGTGQSYDDLTSFTKKTVLKNLGLE